MRFMFGFLLGLLTGVLLLASTVAAFIAGVVSQDTPKPPDPPIRYKGMSTREEVPTE